MQAGINRLGKLFTDAGGFGDFIDTGAVELLQAAEMFQQVAAALGPYPGYILLDLWAKAVERARSTEGDAVVAQRLGDK